MQKHPVDQVYSVLVVRRSEVIIIKHLSACSVPGMVLSPGDTKRGKRETCPQGAPSVMGETNMQTNICKANYIQGQ